MITDHRVFISEISPEECRRQYYIQSR